MHDMRKFLLLEAEPQWIILLGFLPTDVSPTGMIIPLVARDTLIFQEVLLVQRQGELMLMMIMNSGLKDLPLHIVRGEVGNMTPCRAPNVHTVKWMIFLPVMLRLEPALLVLVWIMNLVVLEAHNMGITVTVGQGGQVLDIVAAGVPFLVKILMECIAVVKEAMVEAPIMAVVSVECIHLAMVAST